MNIINICLNFYKDFSSIIYITITSILSLLAALYGLGWSIKSFIKYILDDGSIEFVNSQHKKDFYKEYGNFL